MKAISTEMQDHLDSGATTLCTCWKLTQQDGTVMGFTDHDRDLAFGGATYEAAGGFTASALKTGQGLAVDNLDLMGALSSDRLDEGDLAAGLYDGADIEIWRVNWQAPEMRVLLRKGTLGEVARGRSDFTAEIRGLAHALNQTTGRLYQYGCDADLGDTRCGVDLSGAAFTAEGVVSAASEDRLLTLSGLETFATGFFTRGKIRALDGANEGAVMEVKAHQLSGSLCALELWQPLARAIEIGDRFAVSAGCDKQFETCRSKFANGANFRGFPHMPGNDFVQATVSRSGANDGGRRR
ncbi:MAG: DUF2163 domain-containing protein [Rhizobiales bacterium]|nr:DUF2163 domain-containing protein [Hyphomicrobiales bacterium]